MSHSERIQEAAKEIERTSYGGYPPTWEIIAAIISKHIPEGDTRKVLAGLVDRMGGDGVTAFLNGASVEQLCDSVYGMGLEWERRATISTENKLRRTFESIRNADLGA